MSLRNGVKAEKKLNADSLNNTSLKIDTKKPAIFSDAGFSLFQMERVERIELSYSAWKAGALPLCYTRFI